MLSRFPRAAARATCSRCSMRVTSNPGITACRYNLTPLYPVSAGLRNMSTIQASPPQAKLQQSTHFNLKDKVFIVTGAAQGLGLTLSEGLAEAGGKVYCFDNHDKPDDHWRDAQRRIQTEHGDSGSSLSYVEQDVTQTAKLADSIRKVAGAHKRLDGVIAAAAIQQVTPALDYEPEDVARMMSINYTGAFMTARFAAREMMRHGSSGASGAGGSICFIASMSGLIANRGMHTPVYNSSKAALIQLARSLAMEWSPVAEDGTGGIRVNCISPGNIKTAMLEDVFEEEQIKGWKNANMLGRLAEPEEFKSAALFLMSGASSFATGTNLVIDGGYTSW
ncbi:sorbose reductase [Microdochium nivale]|nr:sorbose reductase [Microdochium nivale]